MPKTTTSPTPGSRASLSLQLQRREIAQEKRVVAIVLGGKRDDLKRRRFLLLGHDALLLNRHRQLRHRRRDAVLDEHLGEIQIRANFKSHGQRVAAIARAVGLHVEHLFHAVDLLFDRQGDRLEQDFRARAGIGRRHLNRGRRDRWILGNRQDKNRDRA